VKQRRTVQQLLVQLLILPVRHQDQINENRLSQRPLQKKKALVKGKDKLETPTDAVIPKLAKEGIKKGGKEFRPKSELPDDETTIDEEETGAELDPNEISELHKDGELNIDELRAKYYNNVPLVDEELQPKDDDADEDGDEEDSDEQEDDEYNEDDEEGDYSEDEDEEEEISPKPKKSRSK